MVVTYGQSRWSDKESSMMVFKRAIATVANRETPEATFHAKSEFEFKIGCPGGLEPPTNGLKSQQRWFQSLPFRVAQLRL
jgi:hypothetical protein